MSNFRSFRISAISSIFALLFFLPTYPVLFAADYKTPHTFKPGDVISAGMMNETFDYIQSLQTPVTMSDIVGTWECRKCMPGIDGYSKMFAYYTTVGSDALWHYLDLTLTISDDNDGTYSWSSPNYNAFTYGAFTLDDCNGSGMISLFNNMFALSVTNCPIPDVPAEATVISCEIILKSPSQIEINPRGIEPFTLTCNKTSNLPPAIPTSLTASASGLTVTLSWTDNSGDETGFKIVRKDTLTGAFSQITTTAANVTSYSDTLSSAGTYWYRVKATNANGDSLGSDEVKVTVAE